jgi:hypothetical protein
MKCARARAAPRPGRIVVMSTPHAAESVARLVLSAMQCADHYFQTAVRNRQAHAIACRITWQTDAFHVVVDVSPRIAWAEAGVTQSDDTKVLRKSGL